MMRLTDCTASFISQRWAVIGAFRSSHCSIVMASSCSLSGPLFSCLLFVLLLLCILIVGIHEFQFRTIPVDVIIRAKSYVHSFFDPTCIPMRISINKLDLVSDRIVTGHVGVFRNGGGLGTNESHIPVLCSLILSCIGLPVSLM